MVFLPVRSMSGVQGRLSGPLAVAYILAIMASLVVALTVTPALSALLLPKAAEQSGEPPFITWLKRHYSSLMESLMLRPILVIAAAAFLCVAAACGAAFLRQRVSARPQGRPLHRSHVGGAGYVGE